MQFEQPRNTEKPLDKQNRKLAFSFLYTKKSPYICPGEMAERSIAAVLKTVEVWASGGSNPSLSANKWLFSLPQAEFFILGKLDKLAWTSWTK